MADGFYKDVTKALKAAGFAKTDGGKGSHEKWLSPENDFWVLVPKNLKSRFTANKIMTDAGIDRRF